MKFLSREKIANGFLKVFRYDFEHNGDTVSREVVEQADAVAVLPYDPVNETVLLVKQFRAPVYGKDGDGILVEACAGLIEPGHDAFQTVKKEAMEELGLKITAGSCVASNIYSSPGAMDQKKYLYLAKYSAEDIIPGAGGGVAAEHEEIEVIEMGFAEFLAMDIRDLKTLVLRYALKEKLGL